MVRQNWNLPQGAGVNIQKIIFERHLLETCGRFLHYLDLTNVICYQKMKGIFFAGRNPKFPCSTVALSKVLLSKLVHSSWWTLTMIFST